MVGEMTVKATEHGFGIDMDFENVTDLDKFELLHSVATGLHMSRDEMIMYCQLERIGVFSKAETVTQCEDDAQLEYMLQGGHPNTRKKMSFAQFVEELLKLAKEVED